MKKLFLILAVASCSNLLYGVQNSLILGTSKNQENHTPSDNYAQQENPIAQKLAKAKSKMDSLAIIMEALTVEGEPSDQEVMKRQGDDSQQSKQGEIDNIEKNKELHKQQSLQTAIKVYNNRFRQNIECSPGVVQSGDKTLYNNFLQGVGYYNNSNRPSPFGESLSIWFNRNECDIETNYNGVVGMYYQKMPKEVVIASRFRQLALRIPYPFPKHIFKAKGGVAIPGFSNKTQIEFMSVPPVRPCSNISDEQLLERLRGQKFVGFTRIDNFNMTLTDGSEVNPFMYTVVEFHKEGYISISYPAADHIIIPDGTYTVRGSIIVVDGKNFGFVKNNGYAINLASPYADNVYKLSDKFSTTSSQSPSKNSSKKSYSRTKGGYSHNSSTHNNKKKMTQRKSNTKHSKK